VEEAKRWGIEVRLPSVNHSRLEYTTEMNATEKNRQDAGATAMRIGLMQVRGLRTETIDAIVRAREEKGAFHTLEDFLARVAVERDEIEALIKCGAFDGMSEETRPALLWRLNLMRAAAPVSSDELLFPNAQLPGPLAEPNAAFSAALAADYTRQQRLMYEREILEVCVSGHPLDGVARNGEVWSDVLEGAAGKKAGPAPNLVGRRVALLGWVVTWRHVGTKDYRNMMFVTMEDQRGLFEAVLFPEAYERYGGIVYESRLLRATGRVERSGQINCEKLEPLRRR
jgi:DNA polymerase III alpha subunit